MARIERESAHLKVVRSQWRETAATDAAFVQPAKGRLSGRFGGPVLNGKPRAPHAGLDVAVMTGTAVLAPADGVILDIGDYYFCGKTMFIDHGNGLLSLFCHLSEWDARWAIACAKVRLSRDRRYRTRQRAASALVGLPQRDQRRAGAVSASAPVRLARVISAITRRRQRASRLMAWCHWR